MFIIFTLISLALSKETCPVYTCGTEAIGVCASKEDGSIILNEIGCTATTYCKLTSISDWYFNGGSYFYCEEFSEDTESTDDVKCGDRDKEEMLQEDIHPKRCNTTDDCILKNGQKSECLCAMDGFSYCQPEWGSEIFDLFWEYCDSSSGNTVSYDMWNYWSELQNHYNYYIAAPDCAMNIFYELQPLASVPEGAWEIVVASVIIWLV